MAPSVKLYRIATLSQLLFSLKCNYSSNISLPRKLPRRNVHLLYGSSSPFSCRLSVHKRQTGISLIAFDAKNSGSKGADNHALDAIFNLYSALTNKITPSKSQILAHECPFLSNFLSFLQAFLRKKQVEGVFSYLIKVFGNNIEIVVKQTLYDGLNIGVQWKFESEKVQIPLGKGFSFYISHSYKGKAMIRNTETFIKPLLHLLPFKMKIMASLATLRESIGSFMEWEPENKAKLIWRMVLSLLAIATLLFFLRLPSFKIVLKLSPRP